MAPSTVQLCLLPSEAWTAVQGRAGTTPNPSRAPSVLPHPSFSPDLYKGLVRKDQMQEEQKSRDSTLWRMGYSCRTTGIEKKNLQVLGHDEDGFCLALTSLLPLLPQCPPARQPPVGVPSWPPVQLEPHRPPR